MNNIFFSADHHFFHRAFLEKYKIGEKGMRNFSSVDEMNDAIVDRHNSIVKKGDLVYCIGDFSFGEGQETCDIMDRLNGNLYYVLGNHETHLKDFAHKFIWIKPVTQLHLPFDGHGAVNGKIKVTLNHYAQRVCDKGHYGAWSLHGHTHGDLVDDPNILSMDVGVDTNNLYPYSWEEVQEHMKKKTIYGKDFEYYQRVLRAVLDVK